MQLQCEANHAVGRATSLDDQHQRLMKTVFGGILTDFGRSRYGSPPQPAKSPIPDNAAPGS